MATQTTYSETMGAAREGQIVNTEHKNLISRNFETDATLGYGKPVSQGINDSGCIATTSGAVLGITVRERSGTADGWTQYQSARIMTQGVVWVTANATIAAGEAVHWDSGFTNTGGVAITNARYDSSGASGDLVKVRLG